MKYLAMRDDEGDNKDGEEGGGGGDGSGGDGERQLVKDGAALIWNGYSLEKDGKNEAQVLRLTWLTTHACERDAGAPSSPDDASKSWGFFTWFVVL